MSLKEKVLHVYDKKYKKLLWIPILMLVLAIAQIGVQMAMTGDFVNKGISLKGGSTISILKSADPIELQNFLDSRFSGLDLTVRSITDTGEVIGLTVESSAQSDTEIVAIVDAIRERIELSSTDYTIEVTGSSLGGSFFRQTFTALILAFILMALVVLVYFRTLIPSAAVVLSAFSDIVVTLAIFNLTGLKLSTAGIAAFLMLIGYSVDTDILLTSRLIKRREGSVLQRLLGAIKTGMTMTATTTVAVLTALLITNSTIVRQIMLILFIGLLVDTVNTWILNAAIIRNYLEKKHGTR